MNKIINIKRKQKQYTIKEEIVIDRLSLKKGISVVENDIAINELITIKENDMEFNVLMSVYEKATCKVLEMINGVQKEYSSMFNKKIVNHTTSRIKTPESIINKMKHKGVEFNYKSLVDNINDIAGVRVICPTKDDVYTMARIIEKIPNWNLISIKDYIKNPKKSGYSGYHIIVEVPVKIDDFEDNKQLVLESSNNVEKGNDENRLENWRLKNYIFVKVEIQIRTMAMDFWATNEHKMKYKTNKKLSILDSKKLAIYAKVINIIDDGFTKISRKSHII